MEEMEISSSCGRYVKYLESIRFFCGFMPEILEEFSARLHPVKLEKNEILFRLGDDADAMYIVIEGALQVDIRSKNGGKAVAMELNAGDPVGEMALLLGGQRNATVMAVLPTAMVKLSESDFKEVSGKYPFIRHQLLDIVLQRLRRSQLAKILPKYFGELDEQTFDFVETQLNWVHLKRGQVLFRKGDVGDGLYILVNGLLHAVDGDREPDDQIIGVVAAGRIVGEMALITRETRSADIWAARDSYLVKISKASFDKISAKCPAFLPAITRQVIDLVKKDYRRPVPVSMAMNIAVVPISSGVPKAHFTIRLSSVLGSLGSTYLLTSKSIDLHFNQSGFALTAEDDPWEPGLSAWLAEVEGEHAYVIYCADPTPSVWTERCLARADQIILLADADDSPNLCDIEKKFLGADNSVTSTAKLLVLLHPDGLGVPAGTSKWLARRDVRNHYHVRWNRREDFKRLGRILSKQKVGLVLGGGGAKGLAHIGVIRALKEAGIPIDMVGGASMGAIIGAKLAMGYECDGMLEMARKLFIDINPFNEFTLPIISFLRGRKLERMGKVAYGDTDIEDLWLNFFCVGTNLTTSRLSVLRRGSLRKAVRTSSSLPGVVAPVLKNGELYVDGGVINNLPGDIMRRQCDVVIVVDVAPTIDMSLQAKEIPSPWKFLGSRILPFKKPIKAPNIIEILISTMLTGSIMSAQAVKKDADLCLMPPVEEIGFLDFKNMEKAADIGYKYTMNILEKLDNEDLKKALFKNSGD